MPIITKKNNWSSSITKYGCYAAAFILSLHLSSCNSSIFDETITLETHSWTESQPLSFEFDIQDTSKLYNIFLEVDHSVNFSHQNFYCMVEAYSPQGLVQQQQSSIELADRKGNWLGDCGSENCVKTTPFIVKTKFDLIGRYQIDLKQYTRQESLKGLNSFRLFIEEAPTP